jgi:two-component system cell cycle response regulator CtrA
MPDNNRSRLMRILLVEDDPAFAQMLSIKLRSDGAVVEHTDSGEAAVGLALRIEYDIVILDLMLPDIHGLDVVRRIREARIETPVLIISGLSQSQSKVKALNAGADDYLTKPFDNSELSARIAAAVRRGTRINDSTFQHGLIQLEPSNFDVRVGGALVRLSGKEYCILRLLMQRAGAVVTKRMFMNHLYRGIDEPREKIIDVFICKLRRRLEAAGAPDVIDTVWGEGYSIRRGPQPQPGKLPAQGGNPVAQAEQMSSTV